MANDDPESFGEQTTDVIDLADRRNPSTETSADLIDIDLSATLHSSREQSISILNNLLIELDKCEEAPLREQKAKQERWAGIMRQSGFRTGIDPNEGGFLIYEKDGRDAMLPMPIYQAARKMIQEQIDLLLK